MRHNDAVTVLGACRCVCHAFASDAYAARACWCAASGRAREPLTATELAELRTRAARAGAVVEHPQLAHNDAVRHFSGCDCPCHRGQRAGCRCSARTDPDLARALARKSDQDLQHRLRTGRATPTEYAKHAPWMLGGPYR